MRKFVEQCTTYHLFLAEYELFVIRGRRHYTVWMVSVKISICSKLLPQQLCHLYHVAVCLFVCLSDFVANCFRSWHTCSHVDRLKWSLVGRITVKCWCSFYNSCQQILKGVYSWNIQYVWWCVCWLAHMKEASEFNSFEWLLYPFLSCCWQDILDSSIDKKKMQWHFHRRWKR